MSPKFGRWPQRSRPAPSAAMWAGGARPHSVRGLQAAMAVALLLGTALAVPASASAGPAAHGPADPAVAAAAPAAAVQAVPAKDWLHVVGNRIVDEAGNQVWLTGANWFGYNASERVFHGLWSGNITQITRPMADRGINIVRVPISTQLLLEWRAGQTVAAPNVNTFANPELLGKNNLQIFDYWLQLCEQYGIKVMLDVHSAEADNSGHIHPVWCKGSITVEQFYLAWEWVTTRYRQQRHHRRDGHQERAARHRPTSRRGPSGTTPPTSGQLQERLRDSGPAHPRHQPQRADPVRGHRGLPARGKTWSSPNTDPDLTPNYYYNWWGGNLRGVRDHPVNLGANQDQLVYSPHDYGPLVFDQPWFQKPFDKTSLTTDVWRPNWLYIHEDGTAPLLIGEWGGRLGQDARQDRWMTALRDLIVETRPAPDVLGAQPELRRHRRPAPRRLAHLGRDRSTTCSSRRCGSTTTSSSASTTRSGSAAPAAPPASTSPSATAAAGPDNIAPSVPGQPTASTVTATTRSRWRGPPPPTTSASPATTCCGPPAAARRASSAPPTGTTFQATGLTRQHRRTRSRCGPGTRPETRRRHRPVAPSPPRPVVAAPERARARTGWSTPGRAASRARWSCATPARRRITAWTVTWTLASGATITQLWNGRLTVAGNAVTVRNETHNGTLGAGATTTFGFTGSGPAAVPTDVSCS